MAKVLNLLGVYLGPDEALLPAAPDNPKGFWEHRAFVKLNDELLARFGGDAMHPPSLPPDWHLAPGLRDLRDRARTFLHEDFAGAAVWGWKDPRTCLTLPFWQHLLPAMRYVLCLRHPLDVARSLDHRDRYPRLHGVHTWLIHLALALRYTADQPRLFVSYDRFLAGWEDELTRIAQFLGDPALGEKPEVRRAVRAFLDPGLRHHRTPPGSAPATTPLTPPSRLFHLAEQIYLTVQAPDLTAVPYAACLLEQALVVARTAIEDAQAEERARWNASVAAVTQAITSIIPAGARFILVDDAQLGWASGDRQALLFLEREGEYWGPPEDDDTALQAVNRLRRDGAAFIAFAWPAFWWLEHYAGLTRHLRSTYRCVLENDRLVIFDLMQAP